MPTEIGFTRLHPIEKGLLWIYIFSFSFDYRGEIGGSVPQFIMAGVAIASGFGFILIRSRSAYQLNRIGIGLKRATMLWWAYLMSTVLTALISGVILSRYIRIFFPLLLCGSSLLIVCKCQKRLIDPFSILGPLLFASVASIIWKFYYSTGVSAIPLYDMRYQMLSSGGVIFIFAYAIGTVVSERHISGFAVFALFLAVASTLLSITRSFAIMALFLIAGYFWIYFRTNQTINIRKHLVIASVFLLVTISSYHIVGEIRSDFLDRWARRMFFFKTAGDSILADVTLRTRLAEWSGQLGSLFTDFSSFFIGKGLGSEFDWDPRFLYGFERFMGSSDILMRTGWYSGHSTWVYSVYSGGLLFGWVTIAMFMASLYRVMAFLRAKKVPFSRRHKEAAIVVFFGTLGAISQGFTSNPLADRFFAMTIGLILGMAFWFYDSLKADMHHQAYFA